MAALLLWSGGFVITRFAIDRVDTDLGFLVVIVTNVILASALVGLRLGLDLAPIGFDARALGAFAMAGLLTSYLGRFLFLNAVAKMGAARASAFVSSSPVFAALLGWLVLDETMGVDRVLAIGTALTGLVVLNNRRGPAARSGHQAAARTARAMLWLGLGSAAAYGAGTALRGVGVRLWSEPLVGALIGAAVGLLLHASISLRRDSKLLSRLRSADRKGLVLYVVMGLTSISAQTLSIVAMQYIPVAEVALITAATPLFVLPATVVLFPGREVFTGWSVLGMLLALAGVGYIVGQP